MKNNQLIMVLTAMVLASCQSTSSEEPLPTASHSTARVASCPAPTLADVEQIPIFPADNPWNKDVSKSLIDQRSPAIIALLAQQSPRLKANFGSGLWEGAPIGVPYVAVCGNQPKVPITFRADDYDGNYGNESDPGPYPIPLNAPVENNGADDSHVIAVDVTNKKVYELYNASRTTTGWAASSGAVFDLTSNARRPEGWTSADASGLSILAGLVRHEEVKTGIIDHAIRFTLRKSKVSPNYVFPASHKVKGGNLSGQAPTPMGMRLRLKANIDLSSYSPKNRIILNAMKKYGIILTDIGSDFFITGAPDPAWNNSELTQLGKLRATDFEVIQMGAIK
ncbi:hypothetical protein L0663_01680 [Dyadobacter sp. CY107]|uniref:hypothetical protein n=1 Tax=Dyadobacter fanqingshengii TaxID=2906443 RepID=UPI001F35AB51|nr:hypothetical protein [Dyadobacter fanqingshengii]MCF2502075.1 hypothetical protein [Dyadobacter fanqingshengii]